MRRAGRRRRGSTAALPLTTQEVEQGWGERIERRSVLNWNDAEGRVEARLERRLGAITLASGPDANPDPRQSPRCLSIRLWKNYRISCR